MALEVQPPRINLPMAPRTVLPVFFKSLGDIPIGGGWGYTIDDAVVIDKNDPTVSRELPFDGVGLEYVFVEKRLYFELITSRSEGECFSGIKWTLLEQRTQPVDGRQFDFLRFEVTALPEKDWNELKVEWEGPNGYGSAAFDLDAHEERRRMRTIRFVAEYWFDITSFF